MNATATQHKMTIKAHVANGLDIDAPVTWINHLGQPVICKLAKEGKFWCVRDETGYAVQNGGPGAKYVFAY